MIENEETYSPNWLKKLGAFQLTVAGEELKGYVPDFEESGTHKVYLNAEECRQVSVEFLEAAKRIERNANRERK